MNTAGPSVASASADWSGSHRRGLGIRNPRQRRGPPLQRTWTGQRGPLRSANSSTTHASSTAGPRAAPVRIWTGSALARNTAAAQERTRQRGSASAARRIPATHRQRGCLDRAGAADPSRNSERPCRLAVGRRRCEDRNSRTAESASSEDGSAGDRWWCSGPAPARYDLDPRQRGTTWTRASAADTRASAEDLRPAQARPQRRPRPARREAI